MDGRADVFSLGVVLYELLAGSRPFGGDGTQQVLEAIRHQEPRPLRRVDTRIPRDLDVICLKAIEKDPHACYQRAGDPPEIRLHGDFHPSNVLITDTVLHIVDLDDARMGPAIQDLWMFLSGDREEFLVGEEPFTPLRLKQVPESMPDSGACTAGM